MTIYVGSSSVAAIASVLNYGADPTGATNSLTAFQNALAANNFVYAPAGTYDLSGGTIELIGKSLAGDGVGVTILKNTSTTNGAMITITASGSKTGLLRDLSILNAGSPSGGSTINVSGTATGGGVTAMLRSIYLHQPYNGIEVTGNTSASIDQLLIDSYTNWAVYVHDGPQATLLTNFVLTTTVSNGATGVGIYLLNNVAGFAATNGEIIGGAYSLLGSCTTFTVGNCPAFLKFTDVYFDSASASGSTTDGGASVTNMLNATFNNCWFSGARPCRGAIVNTSKNITFKGCTFANCGADGCYLENNSTHVSYVGCGFVGNSSVSGSGVAHGLNVQANTTDFSVIGCQAFNDAAFTGFGSQGYGIFVATGTSDRYHIKDNQVHSNATGGVSDGGSGANKEVANNY